MRVWLIGAGNIGSVALRQLQKNPAVEIFVSDPSDQPEAVHSGLIERVDLVANISPVNVNEIARRVRPDLILLSPGIGEQGFGARQQGPFGGAELRDDNCERIPVPDPFAVQP